jgi:hypothetical protein
MRGNVILKIDLQVGKSVNQLSHHRRQQVPNHRSRACNSDHPCWIKAMSVQLFVTVAERPQRVPASFKVFSPGIGQNEALGAAIDQQHLKTLFKTSEGAANGGSGNSEFFCGTTQSAGLSGSNEHHNVIGIILEYQNAFPDARQELREPLNQGFKGTDTEESADHSLTNGLTCRRLALCELVASSTIQIES